MPFEPTPDRDSSRILRAILRSASCGRLRRNEQSNERYRASGCAIGGWASPASISISAMAARAQRPDALVVLEEFWLRLPGGLPGFRKLRRADQAMSGWVRGAEEPADTAGAAAS
jgi:hypothetical protein